MNEFVVLKGRNHEAGEVHAARDVAREDGVADMPAPYGQTLALPFFEIAPAHDCPAGLACKHPSACLHLVVEFPDSKQQCEPSGRLHDRLEGSGVHVLAVPRNVPAAGEYEARRRARVVEYRLSRSRRILVNPPRYEYGEHPVTTFNRPLDDLAAVGRSGKDGDKPLELVEFAYATLPTNANDLVAEVKRMLHHVLPEFP